MLLFLFVILNRFSWWIDCKKIK